MLPASTPRTSSHPLRIGVPWRTSEEQHQNERKKLDYYFASVRRAGAEPVDVPSISQQPPFRRNSLI